MFPLFLNPPFDDPPDNCFVGQYIAVRIIHKRDGRLGFGLYRPYSTDKSIIDEYDNIVEANFIAKWHEDNGGDCGAANRQAARKAWLDHEAT